MAVNETDRKEVSRLSALAQKRVKGLKQKALKRLNMKKIMKFLLVFLTSFPVFAQQEIGRLTLELKITDERIAGAPDAYWYYADITSTLPSYLTSAADNLDSLATYTSQYSGAYMRRTPNGLECKAGYSTGRISLLKKWINLLGFNPVDSRGFLTFSENVFEGSAPLFYEVAFHIAENHNLYCKEITDRWDSFDYQWTSQDFYDLHGYNRYIITYAFYTKE
jgi:hypothetical protein